MANSFFSYWGSSCISITAGQKSFNLWKFVIGLVSVVLMLEAGATLAQAEKKPDHSYLKSDHANLAIDHDGLDQNLDQVLADNQ